MDAEIFVSGDQGVWAYASPWVAARASYRLSGAGAICAGEESLLVCCGSESAIWKLDRRTLTPASVFPAGPGVSRMTLSADGERLYALCSEADSLLMLNAQTGEPMVLNRVGVNPCAMVMDEKGELLIVAGGACGEVFVLDAHSLRVIRRFLTRGMVFSVAVENGSIYALSLTETMDSALTVFLRGGTRRELPLPGLPGALCVMSGCVGAATHRGLFLIAQDGSVVFRRLNIPGRAGRIWSKPEGLLMTDTWTDTLLWRGYNMQRWTQIAEGVRDAECL